MGVPRLNDVVRAAHIKALASVRSRDDPPLKALILGDREDVARGLARRMDIQWPASLECIELWKKRKKDSHANEWANQPFQGKGVSSFKNNPIANGWIRSDTLMPGEVIDMLKMRSNVFPVKSSLSRTSPDEPDTLCRRRHTRTETLGHVVGECIAGKLARIQRHDEIVRLVADKCLEANLTTALEQVYETEEGHLRPDIVVMAGRSALVVDVTVRFEQGDSLAEASMEKSSKYNKMIFQDVKKCMGAESVEVLPLVFGARGAMPRATIKNLSRLGLGSHLQLTSIVKNVIRSSLAIARCHLDFK